MLIISVVLFSQCLVSQSFRILTKKLLLDQFYSKISHNGHFAVYFAILDSPQKNRILDINILLVFFAFFVNASCVFMLDVKHHVPDDSQLRLESGMRRNKEGIQALDKQ